MQIRDELGETHIARYPGGVLIVFVPVQVGHVVSPVINDLQEGLFNDAWNVAGLKQSRLPFISQYGSNPCATSEHSAVNPGVVVR